MRQGKNDTQLVYEVGMRHMIVAGTIALPFVKPIEVGRGTRTTSSSMDGVIDGTNLDHFMNGASSMGLCGGSEGDCMHRCAR